MSTLVCALQALDDAENWARLLKVVEAMKLKDADAQYAAFLRESVLEARADPSPDLSSAAAKEYMDAIKATQWERLYAALRGKASNG
ncbi:hypothetical protein [Pseudoxanthomonas mexicana]